MSRSTNFINAKGGKQRVRNIIKVHRSQINISVVPKAIKTRDTPGGGRGGDGKDAVWFQ